MTRSLTLFAMAVLVLAAERVPVAFEAASIKHVVPGYEGSSRSKVEYDATRVTMQNVDLNNCIEWAYGLREDQISGGNDLGGERYEIVARSSAAAPVSELRIMLQDLLTKRFGLVVRRETKELPVYELVVGKRGAKLPAPKADDGATVHHASESLPRVEDGSFVFAETSMGEFAQKLAMLRGVERPVLDRTGIQGFYDITLKGAATAVRQGDDSLFGLIEEQLGLRLVASKEPVEVLVVVRAERPSEN
jgi:uncharacterized protein (TIGR03435 family)